MSPAQTMHRQSSQLPARHTPRCSLLAVIAALALLVFLSLSHGAQGATEAAAAFQGQTRTAAAVPAQAATASPALTSLDVMARRLSQIGATVVAAFSPTGAARKPAAAVASTKVAAARPKSRVTPPKGASGVVPPPTGTPRAKTALQLPRLAATAAAKVPSRAAPAAKSRAAAAKPATAVGSKPAAAPRGVIAAATRTAPAIKQQPQAAAVKLPAVAERAAVLTPVTPIGPPAGSTKPYAAVARRGQQFVFFLQPPFANFSDLVLEGVSVYFLHWKTPEVTVRRLRSSNRYPVCYITIGAWEPSALDAAEFLPGDLGNKLGEYAGQRFLNIRSANVRRLMVKRIDWCYKRGYVGMHFDGTDFYTGDFYPAWKHEKTGFNLTESDVMDYLRYLSKEVHARDMGWGLLNTQMLIKYLGDIADWYTNEACFTFAGDCKFYESVTKVGRPVYQINYTPENFKAACSPAGLAMNFTSILTDRWLHGCPWESCQKKLC